MSDLGQRIARLSPAQRALLEKRLKDGVAKPAREPIAIIGMGCRFPGGADSPEAYWRLVRDGVDAIREVPSDRWDVDAMYDPDPVTPGKVASRWGGFLDGIDRFDAGFFGISPREAVHMDPQQRLLLEVAWEAFEEAGQTRERLAGSATGVFVGVHSHAVDYLWLQYAQADEMDAFTGTGTAHNLLAGRVSYVLDLQGPAVVVDTACSSSLVAVHLAVQSLRLGESDVALAAGVNLILTPHFSIAASRMHMLAPDGRCKAFDHRANGFVRGEGCGAVVLKRLSDALANGDPIQAVIRGSASNQDGHTNGITAPNGLSQRAVIERALKDAGVRGEDVGYVEAHGTGTSLGDPIEVEALSWSVGRPREDGEPCFLGSAKANLGHLEGGAGIAGLIRATLVLQHEEIPPIVHFERLNPHISVTGTRFRFPTESVPWRARGASRFAGVSSFGWSGSNAHVVLEQAPAATPQTTEADDGRLAVLTMSARSPEALAELSRRYRERLQRADPREALGVCVAAATRRTHLEYRTAVLGRTSSELVTALDATLAGGAVVEPVESPPRVVFVFPGQGSQWLGMGRQLLREEPAFREAITRLDAAIRAEAGWSLLDELEAGPDVSRLREIDIVQPVLFAVEVALAELWRSWGVVPEAVVGHSMGEVAAAHVAGALPLADAVRVICRRSRLLRRIAGRGAMAVVELSVAEAEAALAGFEDRLSVAVSNGPRSTVISGDAAALGEVLDALTRRDVFCRPVKVDVASHSPQVDELRADLLRELRDVRPGSSTVPIASTVTGSVLGGDGFDAEYWVRNLREPVRFFDAVSRLLAEGCTAFIEMSPHPVLLPAIDDAIAHLGSKAFTLPSLRREDDERGVLLASLAILYAQGSALDWNGFFRDAVAAVAIPSYPWQRERFWLDAPTTRFSAPAATRKTGSSDRRDTRGWLYEPRWRPQPRSRPAAALEPGRWLVLVDRKGCGEALAAELAAAGQEALVVRVGGEFDEDGPQGFTVRPGVAEDVHALLDRALEAGPPLVGVVHLWNVDAPESIDSAEALEGAQTAGCVTVVQLVQDLVARQLERPPRMHIVTQGAQLARERPVSLAQAPVWGLGRVVAEEHPECWGGLIDLDPDDASEHSGAALFGEVVGPETEDGVAFAAGGRMVLRLARFTAERDVGMSCRPDGSYIVTGGLGGVGLEVGRWLIERGARHLVLLGRSELPPRNEWLKPSAAAFRDKIDGIRRLEALGANVLPVSLDVADARAVAEFLETFRQEGRPPIRGVLHAAAVAEDVLIPQLDVPRLLSVMRPKLLGGFVLERALAEESLDFMVLFSSLGSILGQPGQANYAAANAFLDALASEIRRRGRHALAVNWGGWADVGLARTGGARRTIDELDRRGIGSFVADEGLDALGRLLDGDAVQAAVVPVDWALYGKVSAQTRIPSIARDLIEELPEQVPTRGAAVRELVEAAEPEARGALLETHLSEQLAEVLKLPLSKVETHRPMGALGLESLTALELRKRLELSLGLRLSATVMWNYPTVAALTKHLLARIEGVAPAAGMATKKASVRLTGVEDLADDEALRALMGAPKETS